MATHDADSATASVFLVNRDRLPCRVSIALGNLCAERLIETCTLADADPYAQNTLADQTRVVLRPNPSAELASGAVSVTLPPISWSACTIGGTT